MDILHKKEYDKCKMYTDFFLAYAREGLNVCGSAQMGIK